MSEPKYTTDPIAFYGRVHYNTSGELEMVEVSVRGHVSQRRCPEPGDDVGDCFEAAFEAAKTQLLTLREVEPDSSEVSAAQAAEGERT